MSGTDTTVKSRIGDPATCATSFFSLKTQFENLGDALINRELVALAASAAPVVVDLSRCPPHFRETLALDNIPSVQTMDGSGKLFRALLQRRMQGQKIFWFLSPGGYFGELSVVEMLKRFPNLLVLLIFWSIGVRICHLGVSYERLGPRHSAFLRWRSRLLSFHMVRDIRSAKYAKAMGMRVDRILPDLALNLFKAPPLARARQGRVALSFRSDQSPQQHDRIREFVQWLVAQFEPDIAFRIIVQVTRDEAMANDVAGLIAREHGRRVEILVCYDDLAACEAAYAECDIVIANRLHALLIGGNQCGHMLACVSGDVNEKIRGLFESLAIANQLIDMDHPRTQADREALNHAMAHPFDGAAIRADLADGVGRMFAGDRRES